VTRPGCAIAGFVLARSCRNRARTDLGAALRTLRLPEAVSCGKGGGARCKPAGCDPGEGQPALRRCRRCRPLDPFIHGPLADPGHAQGQQLGKVDRPPAGATLRDLRGHLKPSASTAVSGSAARD